MGQVQNLPQIHNSLVSNLPIFTFVNYIKNYLSDVFVSNNFIFRDQKVVTVGYQLMEAKRNHSEQHFFKGGKK